MTIKICGIPHKIVECEDKFDTDCHFGQIDYKTCEIRINKDISEESKKETLCHEVLHGMLVHLGYSEQSQDEQFVQALGNAIYQSFEIKTEVPDFEEPCKQEPCENVISRLIVQEEISKSIALKENSHQMYKRIQAIPSVTPQQKVGKWMIHPNGVYAHLVCSKCLTNAPYDCKTNYCPNCGAKMEVE